MISYVECILSVSSEALEVVFEERPRELIRCKDCVYFSSDKDGVPFCKQIKNLFLMTGFVLMVKRRPEL